ncbi:MAG: hypothetical protein V8Q42_05060 [Anaerovoracaceae bacterium]
MANEVRNKILRRMQSQDMTEARLSEKSEMNLPILNFLMPVKMRNHDCLLVIGGCTNCCASYDQFDVKGDVLKMWDETHLKNIKKNFQP